MALLIDTIPYPTQVNRTVSQQSSSSQTPNVSVSPVAKNKATNTVKTAAVAGSVLATLTYLLLLAKFTKKSQFKIMDMFKLDFGSELRVMGLATSSVIGGLIGGLSSDKKENRQPKYKESIHQFLGNIVFPITIVGQIGRVIKKKTLTPVKLGVASLGAAVAGVVSGVIGGNWFASKANEFIFKEPDTRKLSAKDFGIHIDDLLSAMALTPIGKALGLSSFISVALPAIFLICGYEAGTKVKQQTYKM